MQIIALRKLRPFWDRFPNAEVPLRTWYAIVRGTVWSGPADVKRQFGSAVDFVSDNRVIFDIGGNKYRVIVHVAYEYKRVPIKFIGMHEEYDRIDPETV